jgi:hypothetical protein
MGAILPRAWWELVEQANGRLYLGQDGVRDPDFPCVEFVRGAPNGWCDTDGHYMCRECTWSSAALGKGGGA